MRDQCSNSGDTGSTKLKGEASSGSCTRFSLVTSASRALAWADLWEGAPLAYISRLPVPFRVPLWHRSLYDCTITGDPSPPHVEVVLLGFNQGLPNRYILPPHASEFTLKAKLLVVGDYESEISYRHLLLSLWNKPLVIKHYNFCTWDK